MIRRSFRIGLTLGLLGGLAYALAKMLGPRPQPVAPSSTPVEPWPRRAPEPVAAVPEAPRAAPPAGAMATADPAGDATVAEVPAPVPSPPPRPAASPPSAAPPARPRAKKAPLKAAPSTSSSAAKAPRAKKTAVKAAPAKKSSSRATAWVVPTGDVCPTTHPVKAKLASKIFHIPGMLNYDRTRPDRCYRDATAAEDDGLRPAKR